MTNAAVRKSDTRVTFPFPPMEAREIESLPESDGWQYKTQVGRSRCLAFRDADDVRLQSKSGQPLDR